MVRHILNNICSYKLAAGSTIWRPDALGSVIVWSHPKEPQNLPRLLYNGYRVSFPWVKWPGRGVDHPPPSSADVEYG